MQVLGYIWSPSTKQIDIAPDDGICNFQKLVLPDKLLNELSQLPPLEGVA